jgi:hypothetical protein
MGHPHPLLVFLAESNSRFLLGMSDRKARLVFGGRLRI